MLSGSSLPSGALQVLVPVISIFSLFVLIRSYPSTSLLYPATGSSSTVYVKHLRSKHAVVLNLEATNKDVARRLVDFLSGCAYALDGKIKKIAISTYIITPYNVDIVGDLIDELENNGLYL